MKKNTEPNKRKEELNLFEETLVDCIETFMEKGENPLDKISLLKWYANELMAIALNDIPCWVKVKALPTTFPDGIHSSPIGYVLIQRGYFVMLADLIKYLPRQLEE